MAIDVDEPIRAAAVQPGGEAVETPPPILQPGRNCWQMPPAGRARVLIDSQAYFAALEKSLNCARRSIMILGWDFDGDIRLCPDGSENCERRLGEFLRQLADREPGLEIRILVWSLAVLHGPSAPLPVLMGAPWQNHPRIQLRLDRQHPIYAAHHQKIVCIDDAVAYVGGIDLTVRRWDSCAHSETDDRRRYLGNQPYGPVHDIQMVVDGDAAAAVADLARARWHAATRETLAAHVVDHDAWPDGLAPDFTDVPVAISRTMPALGEQVGVMESARLTRDALMAARRTVYIEAQYLSSFVIGRVMVQRLQDPDGPEIVVVMTHKARGWFEKLIMGFNRDRLVRRLKKADRYDRLRIFYPVVPGARQRCDVHVHAKLLIVDDRLIRVGSSNLNNRSIGLDTECELTVEAAREQDQARIRRLRQVLLAEHLGTTVDAVAEAEAREGSTRGAIRTLSGGERTLLPLEALTSRGAMRQVFWTRLLDPARPLEPLWVRRRRRPRLSRRITS
jgi:phosphatidylserine/phosphatidylglycerophosphate/cardiolipin synthase-like enzyme